MYYLAELDTTRMLINVHFAIRNAQIALMLIHAQLAQTDS